MAHLQIDGFLSIKKASFEIKPLTVLIGPQAQGKSVIAKLVYYFETLIRRSLLEVISGEVTETAFERTVTERFVELFPKHTWSTDPFSITYNDRDWSITLTRGGGRRNAPVHLALSQTYKESLLRLTKDFKTALKEQISQKSTSHSSGAFKRSELHTMLSTQSDLVERLRQPVFVPASRSFFANIEKNIFSLISSKFEIDPLIAEFGATLEHARMINRLITSSTSPRSKKKNTETLIKDWSHIIHGAYLYDGKDEFVVSENRKVRLANSSSGQQEVVPLLIALTFEPRFFGLHFGGSSYFIEEPEAHLFPYAQKSVAELLARKLNETSPAKSIVSSSNSVFVTTHSPYILTAINNLVFAGQLRNNPDIPPPKIEKIIPKSLAIDPSKVAAYKVVGGAVPSIVNKKTQLIDSYLIDEISEEFAKDFDALLELVPSPSDKKIGPRN